MRDSAAQFVKLLICNVCKGAYDCRQGSYETYAEHEQRSQQEAQVRRIVDLEVLESWRKRRFSKEPTSSQTEPQEAGDHEPIHTRSRETTVDSLDHTRASVDSVSQTPYVPPYLGQVLYLLKLNLGILWTIIPAFSYLRCPPITTECPLLLIEAECLVLGFTTDLLL